MFNVIGSPFLYNLKVVCAQVATLSKWTNWDQVVHCFSEVGVKFRHNIIHYMLLDICSKSRTSMRNKALMGFLLNDVKVLVII